MEFYDKEIEEKKEEKIEKIENNEEFKIATKYKVKKEKNKLLIIFFVCITIIFIALLCSTFFSLININNTKIIKGISINKIEVGELTKEEALEKITKEIQQQLDKDINIKSNGFEYTIKFKQIELEYKTSEAIENAYKIGRSGNIFTNNFDILNTMIKGENINLEYAYNEELLNSIVEDLAIKIPGAIEESSYYIENEKLYITKGKIGNTINKEKLKSALLDKIISKSNEDIILEVYKSEPGEIDIEKIYNEVRVEPKDAYYVKEPFQVFPHVNGIDFNLEEAKELLKEDKEEYEIPLIITEPQITTNKIGTEAFPDLLSTFSTKYDSSNVPRSTNLKLAMQKLDGVVVNPGETFSYNKTLGKRTAAAGYKEAGGYAGGRVVQTLAGGICQISSTLYDAVIYANLDIIERHNHMFLAGYVGAGKDATVVYGSLDFKFKNTRKYPIMIKTSIGNGVAKVSIFGVKEEVEYDVEISTTILSNIPYKVVYEDDPTLPEGKEKVTQGGMNGCKSITYKILRLNGVEVSREVLSSDTYSPMNKIISRGPTKTVETNTETETPQPAVPQPEEKPVEPNVMEQVPSIKPQEPDSTEQPKVEPEVPEQKPEENPSETPEEEPEQTPITPEENLGENI